MEILLIDEDAIKDANGMFCSELCTCIVCMWVKCLYVVTFYCFSDKQFVHYLTCDVHYVCASDDCIQELHWPTIQQCHNYYSICHVHDSLHH